MNYRNLISALSLLGLFGCSTSQDDTLPKPQTNSEQVWQNQMSGGVDVLSQTQGELRMPLDMTTLVQHQSDYTRDSWREATNLFPRLPNPDVVLYVLPHQSGALPVPGYSTVFPLYERVHYAAPLDSPANLPKERW
ncbi:putative lipoprotein [Vibrio crassostreae]|uniref:TIGR03751 family conjugal transfer lipoprotein n=1 Tax=Vibrio crassostreae TaxID=246167 RepID=UPI0005E48459|nr:TIGR03751 family conjugal transfer lipoprotein [Vibrio crassostreae]MDH5951276.1 TIGR03751 family conjugal transfer lipoprotein [Vibrio crassostreae]TCU02991.1 conjugative transfer region lipoprotein (TIGR03751 family) [Vibrio crassostreae]CAK1767287.1 putative lipoprotein [Vibrio crassostreae]CAK1791787.1 putative lipoprotein [Vibrio crassostreae]CAK1796388.1 putative lipoprotein [Vibrio crassostreae]